MRAAGWARTVAAMSRQGVKCAARTSSSASALWRWIDARRWMSAWICPCHCSGAAKPGRSSSLSNSSPSRVVRSKRSCGLPAGRPSLHSAAMTIVPPSFTINSAARIPFTPWYRFMSSG